MGGCAGFASLGGDAAGELVSTTSAVFHAGKCEAFVAAPWEKMVAAVEQAAGELALTPVKEEHHPEQRKLIYRDDRKQEVVVTVIRRSKEVTELKVDVGIIGVEGLGRLMLQKTLSEVGQAMSTMPASQPVGAKPQG